MLGTPLGVESAISSDDTEESDEAVATTERDAEGVDVTKMGHKMFESMEDVEIVLRFYAYRHLANAD